MKLEGRLVQVAALSPRERSQMFALMDSYYEGVSLAAFNADLAEKQWVIQLLEPRTERLCGFSTQMLLRAEVAGLPVCALFSGDTIVARDRWGDSALAHVWGRLALGLIDRMGRAELYWFLISKGYKTYRYLPLFFREFFPRDQALTPARMQAVLDALARAKYPVAYDPSRGIISAGILVARNACVPGLPISARNACATRTFGTSRPEIPATRAATSCVASRP